MSQHQGVPLVTAANTVIFAVTDVVDNFSFCRNSVLVLRALDPAGNLMWTANTDWIIPPNHVVTANWVPHYQPVLGGAPGPSQRIYYPGPGGTIRWRDNLDQPNPISSGSCGGGAVFSSRRSSASGSGTDFCEGSAREDGDPRGLR